MLVLWGGAGRPATSAAWAHSDDPRSTVVWSRGATWPSRSPKRPPVQGWGPLSGLMARTSPPRQPSREGLSPQHPRTVESHPARSSCCQRQKLGAQCRRGPRPAHQPGNRRSPAPCLRRLLLEPPAGRVDAADDVKVQIVVSVTEADRLWDKCWSSIGPFSLDRQEALSLSFVSFESPIVLLLCLVQLSSCIGIGPDTGFSVG